MSYEVPFGGRMAGQSRPLIPNGEHHGGKGTEEKGDIQGRGEFFCRLAIGGKRRRKGALTRGSGKVLTSGGDGIMVSIYVCCPRFPTRSSAGWLFG